MLLAGCYLFLETGEAQILRELAAPFSQAGQAMCFSGMGDCHILTTELLVSYPSQELSPLFTLIQCKIEVRG